MAFLNKDERDALLDEIKDKNFNRIRNHLYAKDQKGRLGYYRNVQESGKWMTRYILEGLGTQVTVVETLRDNARGNKKEYVMEEIMVEPMPENRL